MSAQNICFLSFNAETHFSLATEVENQLHSRSISCFQFMSSLAPGTVHLEAVMKSIQNCQVFVLFLGPVVGPYQYEELQFAATLRTYSVSSSPHIIPVLLPGFNRDLSDVHPLIITLFPLDLRRHTPDALSKIVVSVIANTLETLSSGDWRHSTQSINVQTGSIEHPFSGDGLSWLRHIYEEEIYSRLAGGAIIFDRNRSRKAIKSIQADPMFGYYAGHGIDTFGTIYHNISEGTRLGLGANEAKAILASQPPLKFVVSPAHAGTLAILNYLREAEGVSIAVDFQHTHSVEILRLLLNKELHVDAFTLTVATAAVLMSKSDSNYVPFLLLPPMSHGVLAPAGTQPTESLDGEFLLMKELPGTEYFIFRDMVSSRHLCKSIFVEAQPYEVTRAISEQEQHVRAIIGFPHYHFNARYNEAILMLESAGYARPVKPIILFLRADHAQSTQKTLAIETLLRHSWMCLLTSKSARSSTIDRLINDVEYQQTLVRITGVVEIASPTTTFGADWDGAFQSLEDEYNIQRTTADVILNLRRDVLRTGGSLDEVMFHEDNNQGSIHLAAFDQSDSLVGCLSLLPSYWNACSAWQLRGMAIDHKHRRRGVGRRLIKYVLNYLERQDDTRLIWCNAREDSEGFYSKLGWRIASGTFINGKAGSSIKMVLDNRAIAGESLGNFIPIS